MQSKQLKRISCGRFPDCKLLTLREFSRNPIGTVSFAATPKGMWAVDYATPAGLIHFRIYPDQRSAWHGWFDSPLLGQSANAAFSD
jgi:hypothetical protein